MKVINTIAALKSQLGPTQLAGHKVALVPTMGALHKGHVSLIKIAQQQADVVVCSIFVNPTQFTDPKDLEKYPRPLEHDMRMLEETGCNIVFMPTVIEMYPEYPKPENWHIDLGPAEFILEGEFRRGHYQGVTQIVKKLFDAVSPDMAFFGQKDFQQVLMIENMVAYFKLPIEIITCPIVREEDGLAMSSRNIHLDAEDRKHAVVLSQALEYVKDAFRDAGLRKSEMNFDEINLLEAVARRMIGNKPGIDLDYFVIVDNKTLTKPLRHSRISWVALVAAKVGQTRLIDNMILS